MKFFQILAVIIGLNSLVYAVYAYDKRCAVKGLRRVSESNLHLLAMVGGSIGALTACYMIRHKTKKPSFLIPLWVIVGLQAALLIYMVVAGPPDVVRGVFDAMMKA